MQKTDFSDVDRARGIIDSEYDVLGEMEPDDLYNYLDELGLDVTKEEAHQLHKEYLR